MPSTRRPGRISEDLDVGAFAGIVLFLDAGLHANVGLAADAGLPAVVG